MQWYEFHQNVIGWAEARSIIPNSNASAQRGKSYEEFAEAYKAFMKKDWDEFKDGIGDTAVTIVITNALEEIPMMKESMANLEPVTPVFPLVDGTIDYLDRAAKAISEHRYSTALQFLYYAVAASRGLHKFSWSDCLEKAWNEIKDRTGTMGEDGVFYKSQ